MNYTANYKLPVWEMKDRIQMQDFNSMTAKLDAVIAAEQTARTQSIAALNAQITRLGNCKLYTCTYTGNGTYGSENAVTHTFPNRPVVLFINGTKSNAAITVPYSLKLANASNSGPLFVTLQWNGNAVSWYNNQGANGQLNLQNELYQIVALIVADA